MILSITAMEVMAQFPALDASTGEKLSEVKTDTQGKVVLKSFNGRRLKLVLNAGMARIQ
jgi:hypothetical protein